MKVLFSTLLCAFLLLVVVTVDAVDFEIVGGTSQLSFGGSNEHKKETFTQTFKVKNNIPAVDTISLRAFTKVVTVKNDFRESNVQISASPDTIAFGQESTITVTVKPEDFDIVDNDLKKRGSVEIGTLALEAEKFNTTENIVVGKVTTSTLTLKLELKNDLDLISVELKGSEGTFNTIGADSTQTITVDEDYSLKFKVKNTFDSSSNIELQNINIKIFSDDLGLDKSTSISEVLAGATGEKTTTISVKDTGTGEVKLLVTGDDKFGGKHGELFLFNFKVVEQVEEEPSNPDDGDGDGVVDSKDECLDTVSVCEVDAVGCPIDSDNDGTCDALDPTPRPIEREQNKKTTLDSGSEDEAIQEDTTKEKKESSTDADSTSGFIPFLIGFAVGIMVTAGFSVLIKS